MIAVCYSSSVKAKSAEQQSPAPLIRYRLLLWFGIYLAAQVPMIWRGTFPGEGYNVAVGLFLMPCALGMIVAIPLNLLPSAIAEDVGGAVIACGLVAGFFAYAWNLYAILRASSRRRFSFLVLIDVTMVLANQGMFWQMAHSISG